MALKMPYLYCCPVCPRSVNVNSYEEIRVHLSDHEHYRKLKYPLRCQEVKCGADSSKIFNFIRHLKTHKIFSEVSQANEEAREDFMHVDVPLSENQMEVDHPSATNEEDGVENENHVSLNITESLDRMQKTLTENIMSMVFTLRAKKNVPYSVSLDIVHSVESFMSIMITDMVTILKNHVSPIKMIHTVSPTIAVIVDSLEKSPKNFEPFQSEHKIYKLYESHPEFVAPKTIPIGQRVVNSMTANGPNAKVVDNLAQFIPISQTMKSKLKNPRYLEIVLKNQNVVTNKGIYTRYQDGSRNRHHPLVPNEKLIVIPIQLYSDGLGMTNPLSGVASDHNCTNFYFIDLCLPPLYHASLSNINLVACCKTKDVKEQAGQEAMLMAIVDDLHALETNGFEIEVPGRGVCKVLVTLAQFTAENLAINQTFGLIESFSKDFCCALCYCTKVEMQNGFYENCFVLRTPALYEVDLADLKNSNGSRAHVRGVKYVSVFNLLVYYHIMNNWINDSMHTFLEGIVPYVIGLILETLIADGLFTVDELNDSMLKVMSVLRVEKKNKPNDVGWTNGKITFKMSSAKMWLWARYLPVCLYDKIPAFSEHWQLLIYLQEILDLVMAPKLYESSLLYFDRVYASFLELFKSLYPNQSIRPKMHFGVHFSTIVRKNGPMRTFWAMNYERLNGNFKQPTHVMNNYRNVPLTLAKKHQCSVLEAQLSKDYLSEAIEISSIVEANISDFPTTDFGPYLTTPEQSTVQITDKIVIHGTAFKKGYFVLVETHERGYVFGKIDSIVCINPQEPLFLLNLFNTNHFDNKSFCYCIERRIPSENKLYTIDKLLDFHPLDCFEKNNALHIRLKYIVF